MGCLNVDLSEHLQFLSSAEGVNGVASGLLWPSINSPACKLEATSLIM